MNPIALQIADKSHALLEPNLHDGRLVGITLPTEGTVELAVTEVGGKRYRIVLEGVTEFHATEFREGNIILDVTVTRGENVRLADLAHFGYAGQNLPRSEEHLQRIHKRMLRESLYLVELNPSYGCHLVGVARSVSVLRTDDGDKST